MDAFNSMIADSGLIDAGFKGQSFTWSNNRDGCERVRERLDRALVNKKWIEEFPQMTIIHKPAIGSDHCPILIQTSHQDIRGIRPFRFEEAWTRELQCEEVIDRA